MDLIWLLARLALAGVFAVAGVGKLLDLKGSATAARGFGVPERYSRAIGTALPIAELVAAVLLLPVSTAFWGALLASLLLLAFVGGIVNSLRKGETPDCHCFGQFHSEPIGRSTLIRNGVLLALGVLVLTGGMSPGYSLLGWLDDESGAVQVLTALLALVVIALVVEGWLLTHLLGQNGRLLIRLDELAERAPEPSRAPSQPMPAKQAPAFAATGLIGERISLDTLRAPGKPILLVFTDPGCGPCNALMPEVGTWQKEHAEVLTVAVVTRGSIDDVREKAEANGLKRVAIEHDRAVSKLYDVPGTPAAVLIARDGTIDGTVAAGSENIRNLVNRATVPRPSTNGNGSVPPPPRLGPGSDAPVFALPNRAGEEIESTGLPADDVTLIFWNPGCGFCKRMLPELNEWVTEAGANPPAVIAITSGTPETTEGLDFAAEVLLDQGFATGRLFGASGTPSAIGIGADGKITHGLVVGGPAIMEVLRSRSGVNAGAAD